MNEIAAMLHFCLEEYDTSPREEAVAQRHFGDALLNYLLLLQPTALQLEFEDQRVIGLWEMATSAIPLP